MKDYHINREICSTLIYLKETDELFSISKAIEKALTNNTDLIELSTYTNKDNIKVSVCILQDYQKFIYWQKRKEKEQKINRTKNIIKELRFSPWIDKHDYDFKLKQAREFIKSKAKIKLCVIFKGRGVLFKDQGEVLLLRFASDISDIAKIESMPKIEGKRMYMTINPK